MCERKIRIPPCVTHATICIEAYEHLNGEIPCALWEENSCRPYKLMHINTGEPSRAVIDSYLHHNCPISTQAKTLTEKEKEIRDEFLLKVSGIEFLK